MITIIADNSYSKIQGLTPQQFKEIRKLLSYEIDSQAAYFSNNRYNTTRYCIDKYGSYPSGLTFRVVDYLEASSLKYEIKVLGKASGKEVDHQPCITKEPYNEQIQALQTVSIFQRTTLCMPTGSGKSLVIALIVASMGVRTLIVVPNLTLKEQLTADFKSQFRDLSHITILNIDSPLLETAKNYDLLIIDEAHHVAASTYQKLNKTAWTKIHYRVFLTATPFRSNDAEMMLYEGIAGPVSYRLPYTKAIEQKMIVPVEAYYLETPKQVIHGNTWSNVYREAVVENKPRNEAIAALLQSLPQNTLCLVKEVRHGWILSELTGIPFANGSDDESRVYINQFANGEIKDLIATAGLVGEGTDTKACEVVIIAGLGKAKGAFMQQVGRCVRKWKTKETGKVILISDKSHKWPRAHFKEQCKILLDEYNVVPLKID